jgi:LacI family transcriptional regulator
MRSLLQDQVHSTVDLPYANRIVIGMPPQKVSMREIAAQAGVSVSAVSLALQNSPRISKAVRDKIHDIATRMGYRPDPRVTELMEHLRMKRSERKATRLAVLIPELDAQGVANYHPLAANLEGMHEQANLAGFELEILYLETLQASLARVRGILLARGISGLLLAPFRSGVGKLDMDFSGFCVATAGYSITRPDFNRACPNYLQMMDEMLEHLCQLGYRRIGFIMTYHEGGIGHKLFSSSYLYYQTKIRETDRIPILPREAISKAGVKSWMRQYQPDVVISSGEIYALMLKLGHGIPDDIGFASLDLSEPPYEATGMYHRHRQVGREAVKLVLTSLNFNLTGVPAHPKTLLVDSHLKQGGSLRQVGDPIAVNLRKVWA